MGKHTVVAKSLLWEMIQEREALWPPDRRMQFIHIKVICGVLYVRCRRGGLCLMIEKPNSSIRCGLFGHKWEEWTPHPLYNIVGVPYTFRNCFRCNAQNYKVL